MVTEPKEELSDRDFYDNIHIKESMIPLFLGLIILGWHTPIEYDWITKSTLSSSRPVTFGRGIRVAWHATETPIRTIEDHEQRLVNSGDRAEIVSSSDDGCHGIGLVDLSEVLVDKPVDQVHDAPLDQLWRIGDDMVSILLHPGSIEEVEDTTDAKRLLEKGVAACLHVYEGLSEWRSSATRSRGADRRGKPPVAARCLPAR